MARVYLETSFVSACVEPRKDAASVYQRQSSLEWWDNVAKTHDCFVSAEVIKELSHPSYPLAPQALDLIRQVPSLKVDEATLDLARLLVAHAVVPGPLGGDSVHLAAAAVHTMHFLLTWNQRHLANPRRTDQFAVICARFGYPAPRVVTPEALMGE